MKILRKYELDPSVVTYLLQAVEAQQIKGSQAAQALLQVQAILRNPVNLKEIEAAGKEEAPAEAVEPKEEEENKA